MRTFKIIVSGGKDHYGAWARDIKGIYGVGETLAEVEQDIRAAIEISKEYEDNMVETFKEPYELAFVFDASGLVKYYSQFITLPAMEKLTGINQKQLWQYANGYKTPKKETAEKIRKGLKEFAERIEAEEVFI